MMVKKQLVFGRKTMEIGNEKKVFHLLSFSLQMPHPAAG